MDADCAKSKSPAALILLLLSLLLTEAFIKFSISDSCFMLAQLENRACSPFQTLELACRL